MKLELKHLAPYLPYGLKIENPTMLVGKREISEFTLDRWNFETPFDNEICIIRKSELFVSTRSSK